MHSGFGPVSGVDFVGCLLEEKRNDFPVRFEDRRAHPKLQLPAKRTIGGLGLELPDDLLDFLVLRQNQLWQDFFFFTPAAMSERVCSTLAATYSSTSD